MPSQNRIIKKTKKIFYINLHSSLFCRCIQNTMLIRAIYFNKEFVQNCKRSYWWWRNYKSECIYLQITPKPDKLPLECATFVCNPYESCDTDFSFFMPNFILQIEPVTTRTFSTVHFFGELAKQISTLNDQLFFVKSADATTKEGWGLPRGHRTAMRSAWPHSASPARSGMGPDRVGGMSGAKICCTQKFNLVIFTSRIFFV